MFKNALRFCTKDNLLTQHITDTRKSMSTLVPLLYLAVPHCVNLQGAGLVSVLERCLSLNLNSITEYGWVYTKQKGTIGFKDGDYVSTSQVNHNRQMRKRKGRKKERQYASQIFTTYILLATKLSSCPYPLICALCESKGM